MSADQTAEKPGVSKSTPRFRPIRVLVIGILGGSIFGPMIGLFLFVRRPDFQEIRSAWLAEQPLAEQLQKRGARFNEIIWWTPECGESFLFACAYKHYPQVQHIRFSNPDVSDVPFSRLKEFEHLESIDLSDTNIRADQIAEMRNKEWVMIELCRTKVTSESVRDLITTNRLTYLSLAGSTVTDEMLMPLTNSTVQVLSLDDTKITDAGMVTLAQMPCLTSLSLAGTKIGDEGLRALSRCNLWNLNLRGTAITDAGLTNLLASTLDRRLTINLSNTRVSDRGMVVFKGMTSVDELNLANAQVSDAGLESLKAQGYLRWLCVGGTKVTSAAVESLLKIRAQQKAEWKAKSPRDTAEPPDLLIVTDTTQTERPAVDFPGRY